MVADLKAYIRRTELIRESLDGNNEQSILSNVSPHKSGNSHP